MTRYLRHIALASALLVLSQTPFAAQGMEKHTVTGTLKINSTCRGKLPGSAEISVWLNDDRTPPNQVGGTSSVTLSTDGTGTGSFSIQVPWGPGLGEPKSWTLNRVASPYGGQEMNSICSTLDCSAGSKCVELKPVDAPGPMPFKAGKNRMEVVINCGCSGEPASAVAREPGGPARPQPQPGVGGAGGSATATLVGIVLPADIRPGDQISGSVVINPQELADIPGLKVVQAEIPLMKDEQGTASLEGVVVDTGNGKPQSASGPLLLQIGQTASQIAMSFLRQGSSTPLAQRAVDLPSATATTAQTPVASSGTTSVTTPATSTSTVPTGSSGSAVTDAPRTVSSTTPSTTTPASPTGTSAVPSPASYTTPPVHSENGVQVVHGPFAGSSASTAVAVDGEPAKILAESPRAVFYKNPAQVAPGAHRVLVSESGRPVASFPVSVVGLRLTADSLEVVKGGSTGIHASVVGADSIPASAWKGGVDNALVDTKQLSTLGSGVKVPKAGDSGAIVLHVQNGSRETVKLANGKDEAIVQVLHRDAFASGPYTFHGRIVSTRGGPFKITARVLSLLAPIPGETPDAGRIGERIR